MAKKNKKNKENKETTIENYYDLKVDKVDELVAALKGDDSRADDDIDFGINSNTGVYDSKNVTIRGREKQFDPYKTDFLSKIPTVIKALFVKFWFAGMVCFFIMWGIGLQDEDAVLLMGVVLGIVVDVFVNPVFRFMETDRREYDNYMMFPFPFKAIWTFFANIIYYAIILVLVNFCYLGVNELMNIIKSTEGVYYLAVEPLMFGVFAVVVDMVFIGVKDGIVALVRRVTNRKKEILNV